MEAVRGKASILGLLFAVAMLVFALPGVALADDPVPSITLGKPAVSRETTTPNSFQFPDATGTLPLDDWGDEAYSMLTITISGPGVMEKTPGAILLNDEGTCASFDIQELEDLEYVLQSVVFAGCGNATKIEFTLSSNETLFYTNIAKNIYKWGDHYYMYAMGKYSWSQAYNMAKKWSFNGLSGYLATITSQEEFSALRLASTNAGWIGGTLMVHNDGNDTKILDDEQISRVPGSFAYRSTAHYDYDKETAVADYYWACGPEAGQPFDGALSNSDTEPNAFEHIDNDKPWDPARNQLGMTKYECCLAANNEGKQIINDITEAGYIESGYADGFFVEFGGYGEDAEPGNPDPDLDTTVTYAFGHEHDLSYNAAGNVLTVTCSSTAEGLCGIPSEGLSLTLVSGTKKYDGATVEAVGTSEERAAWEAAGLTLPEASIAYSETEDGAYEDVDEIDDAGYYKIKIAVGDEVAESMYCITEDEDDLSGKTDGTTGGKGNLGTTEEQSKQDAAKKEADKKTEQDKAQKNDSKQKKLASTGDNSTAMAAIAVIAGISLTAASIATRRRKS